MNAHSQPTALPAKSGLSGSAPPGRTWRLAVGLLVTFFPLAVWGLMDLVFGSDFVAKNSWRVHLDDVQIPATLVHGVEDDEADEARPDEGNLRPGYLPGRLQDELVVLRRLGLTAACPAGPRSSSSSGSRSSSAVAVAAPAVSGRADAPTWVSRCARPAGESERSRGRPSPFDAAPTTTETWPVGVSASPVTTSATMQVMLSGPPPPTATRPS